MKNYNYRLFLSRYADTIRKILTFVITTILPLRFSTNLWIALPGVLLTIVNGLCDKIKDPTPERILTNQEIRYLKNKVCRGQILCTTLDGKDKLKYVPFTHDKTKYLLDNKVTVNLHYKEQTDQEIYELWGNQMDVRYIMDKIHETELKSNEFTVSVLKGKRLTQINYRSNPVYEPEFIGLERFKGIDDKVNKFMTNEDFYIRTGLPYKIGFCFSGIKGLGKTQIAYAMAKKYKLNVIEISPDFDFNILDTTASFDNCVLLLDDFDLFEAATSRDIFNKSEDSEINEETKKSRMRLKNLMKFLEGHYFHQTIIIATTNYPNRIEDALLRPGRLDYLVEFGLIEDPEIRAILKRFYDDHDLIDKSEELFEPIAISSLIHDYIIPNMHDIKKCLAMLSRT